MFDKKLREVQQTLKEQNIEGWLLYDYKHSNTLAHEFLEIPSEKHVTRRFLYWIPKIGEPIKIVPLIEPYTLDHLPGVKWFYRSWTELERLIFSITTESTNIAMEYSSLNSLPSVSKVDAGTIELIQKSGAKVVSSANILQKYTSVLSPTQLKSHFEAAKLLETIVDKTWTFILSKTVTEYDVQQFMLNEMITQGYITDHPPICAVNAHSADPHYSPEKSNSKQIHPGDFILLDLWCKKDHPDAIYADIARVGVLGKPTARQQEIFEIVKKAREMAISFISSKKSIQAWEVDQQCRDYITKAGYGEFFIHRTGHNIGKEVHGPGANLDNFETHDFRELLPGTCFSVEPGIYLPQEFGVRLEYDVYLTPTREIQITGGIQEKIFHP